MAYEPLTKEDYAIAASNGISRATAYRRYENDFWPKEEAITKKPKGRRERSVTGLTTEHYEIAAKNGISAQSLYNRRENLKWPIEKCITWPVQEKVNWNDWKELAAKSGIGYGGFWKRIKKGMTPMEAATMPNKKKNKSLQCG